MSLLGKQIKVSGVSQKGKNRIRQFGDTWVVLAETDRVLFSPSQAGPWIFMAPKGCDQDHKASRWIHGSHDLDFLIQPELHLDT